MSEQVEAPPHSAEAHAPVSVAVPPIPFTEQQIDQFDADDGDAGRAIGKMLALFFLYTVIVMSAVGFWTFKRAASVENAKSSAAKAPTATHAAEAH